MSSTNTASGASGRSGRRTISIAGVRPAPARRRHAGLRRGQDRSAPLEMGELAFGDARADRRVNASGISGSRRGQFAALHHQPHAPDGGDVARRIALDRDQVGEQARADRAAVGQAEDAGRCPRSRRSARGRRASRARPSAPSRGRCRRARRRRRRRPCRSGRRPARAVAKNGGSPGRLRAPARWPFHPR